jgi:hypothetical protein
MKIVCIPCINIVYRLIRWKFSLLLTMKFTSENIYSSQDDSDDDNVHRRVPTALQRI